MIMNMRHATMEVRMPTDDDGGGRRKPYRPEPLQRPQDAQMGTGWISVNSQLNMKV